MSVQELIDRLMKIEDKSRPVYIVGEPEENYYMTLESVTEPVTPWVFDGDGEARGTIEDDEGEYVDVDDSTPGAFYPVLLEDR